MRSWRKAAATAMDLTTRAQLADRLRVAGEANGGGNGGVNGEGEKVCRSSRGSGLRLRCDASAQAQVCRKRLRKPSRSHLKLTQFILHSFPIIPFPIIQFLLQSASMPEGAEGASVGGARWPRRGGGRAGWGLRHHETVPLRPPYWRAVCRSVEMAVREPVRAEAAAPRSLADAAGSTGHVEGAGLAAPVKVWGAGHQAPSERDAPPHPRP